MCGIAGIISSNTSLLHQQRLQRMADSLQHRGPDGEGFWINENNSVGFAHRRLSIIDLTIAASQPMHYLHYTIIFNGEIYNYIELKNELQKSGYHFTTNSDTEVIPAAYDHWGKDCLQHFDGMFAFAISDAKQYHVFLARDRFGEKPLYYHADYFQRGKFNEFIFASEMKALWVVGLEKQLNAPMMLNYITEGYVQNPVKKTETFYSNILSLPPGHCLTVQPTEGRVQMQRWYKPLTNQATVNEQLAEEKFRELFFTSVQRRLRSDTNVGTSLSGGLDSSSIIAAIHENKNAATKWTNAAFTANFPGFEKDETEAATAIANHFGLKQYFVSPTADDLIKYFEQLMYHQEEPLQSSSVLAQFMVYKTAKENNVIVLLDGQGADEILSGYKKYSHWYLQSLFRNNTSLFFTERKLLQQNNLMEQWSWRNYAAVYFPEKAAETLQQNAISRQKNNLFINKDFLNQYQNKDSLQKPVIKQLEDVLYYNTFQFGLEELLRYADRNSMAHSTEVRLPFLFHELVEFIFSLSSSYKIQDGFTKWILRKTIEKYFPTNIVWKPGKTGFEPPQHQWMQNKQVGEMIMEARKKLVDKNVLNKNILNSPIQPKHAHEADNFDWRSLCAAKIF